MQTPNIANELRDPASKAIYRVMAYRALTRQELIQIVGTYLRQHAKPKLGEVVTLSSTLGLLE